VTSRRNRHTDVNSPPPPSLSLSLSVHHLPRSFQTPPFVSPPTIVTPPSLLTMFSYSGEITLISSPFYADTLLGDLRTASLGQRKACR